MRLAFIGGSGHHYLRKAVEESPHDFEIAVAGDGVDDDAARNFANHLPDARWFENARVMLDEFRPEAASIGAVYAHNGDWAAQALERGVAVVCDKPIAASWAQLQRLRELTQDRAQILLTEFPFRARAEFRAARHAIAQGAIGEVVLATAQKSYRFGVSRPAWYARRADYAGTMLWIASHGIDAIRFCGGQEFGRVIGVGGNLSRRDYQEMEDHCVALFELKNGGSAVVHADFLRPSNAATHGDDRLRIAGSRGVVEVREGRCRLTSNDQAETDITDSVAVRPVHQEFLAALRGEASQWYSTEDSLAVAEILLHARDAADARSWQSFDVAGN